MKHNFLEKLKTQALKKDNLIICILTGVLFLVIVWPVGGSGSKSNSPSGASYDLWGKSSVETAANQASVGEESVGVGQNSSAGTEEQITASLEQRLEEMLAAVSGVGRVKVMVTLSSKGERIVEKDAPVRRSNTVENDSEGGSRSISETDTGEETIYVTDSDGAKMPYVVMETLPQVAGVSVAAEGGDNSLVQKNITEVIQALFGIEVHKIKVVKMKQVE